MLISDLTPPYHILLDEHNTAYIHLNYSIENTPSGRIAYKNTITHISSEPFKGPATTIIPVPDHVVTIPNPTIISVT